ncbi:MAG: haloacid dehalogenase type II [Phycisphaerae bacterium]
MNLHDFQALTFDCYGTLIDWETGLLNALRPWTQRCGLGAADEDLLTVFGELEPAEQAARPTTRYPEILRAVLAKMAAHFGVDATVDELAAFGESVRDWPAFADSPAALASLKESHKLVIVSNIDHASFAHSARKLGVAFDLVITAEDVGSYKPAPGHFTAALAALADRGIPRERVLHVAQSLFHDHVPAKALGLHTVWVNRRAGRSGSGATRTPDVVIQPDLVVQTLAELAAACRVA